MRLGIRTYLFIVGFFTCGILAAQHPARRFLDYKSGLPSNTVYNIFQDSKGYIWMGHEKGLSRYNGQRFKHFAGNMVQSRGISNLSQDKFGNIWCQNFSGEIYFTKDGNLIHDSLIQSKGNFIPFIIYQGTKLLTIRDGKILVVDIESGAVTEIQDKEHSYAVTNVLAADKYIYAFSNNKANLVRFNSLALDKTWSLPKGLEPNIFCENAGKVYLFPRFGNQNAAILDEVTNQVRIVKIPVSGVIQNATFIDGHIWLSTSEGAVMLDKDLNFNNSPKVFFPDCNVSMILKDREGLYWMSTLNKGVIVVPEFGVTEVETGAQSITTVSYFSSVNKIILGTADNRIYEFDPVRKTTKLLSELGPRNDVLRIYNDIPNDRIWISSDKLYTLRAGTNTVEFEMTVPMKDIVYLSDDYYAIATPEGISLIRTIVDTTDQKYAKMLCGKSIPWGKGLRQLIPGSEGRAKSIAWDENSKTLYASNYRGLFSWSNGVMQRYKFKGSDIYASDILVKNEKTYVGTYGGRLLVVENNIITKVVDGFNGLEGRSILRIRQFGDFLWLLFENAIVRYNIYKQNYTVINASDGLPNAEIKDIAVAEGEVFLATREGLYNFNENIEKHLEVPTLQIEEFSANHIPFHFGSEMLYLRTNENNLEVILSALSFRNNEDIRVEYSINNQGWIGLTKPGRSLNLVGLAPGKYTLRFRAITADGKEVPADQILRFKIASPVYARWWFILLILFFVSGLVFYFMRFRIYELKKEAEFKSAREKLERELQISTLASIKSQMNPHFVFNALNTVQSFIFTNDRENASDYLSKFSELTRMILDMSNKEKISLAEEIKALTLYLELEKRRFEDSISYQIVINENINPDMVQIPSMLIQPYVENAIKHGLLHKKGEQKLKIEFVRENNAVIAFIDDNGIGRKKSQELKAKKPSSHKSFASEANSKRLELLNQGRKNTISIEYLDKIDSYGNSLGTMVILAIPVNF